MEENELEEGEAHKEDRSIDPDVALSYIDERIQNVLGHFQKDFEGGVSADNLGAKFGGYGSFLPTYQRSPLIRSQPKSPQRVQNHIIPRSPSNMPVEGAPQSSTAISDAPLSQRPETATHILDSSHNASAIQVPSLSSGQAAEKLCLTLGPSSNKSINPTDHRTLKVRIKVGSGKTLRKNAAIYSGLGLISPSSLTGTSAEESGGLMLESREKIESPTSILQIMTSSPVPGSILLSPLHDSVLCLVRKEKLLQNSKSVRALKNSEEQSASLVNGVNGAPSMLRDGRVSKEKKTKLVRENEILVELKPGDDLVFEENITSVTKNNPEYGKVTHKKCLSSDIKLRPLSKATCDVVDTVKGALTAEAEKGLSVKESKADKDGMEDGLSYTDSGKEDSFESISGQYGKYEKQEARSSWVEKTGEHRTRSFHRNDLIDLREGDRSKVSKIYSPFKADSDVSRCNGDPDVWAMNNLKANVVHKSTPHEQDENKMPQGRKSSFQCNRKSKGSQSNPKVASDLAEKSLMVGISAVSRDKKRASKMPNMKSERNICKARDKPRNVLEDTRREQMDRSRCTGGSTKDSDVEALEKELHASCEKLNGRSSYKEADNQLTSATFLKEVPNDCPPNSGTLASELEPTMVSSVDINDHWVCCDQCQTWRLLPFGMTPDQLPDKWLCSMLNWLPGMNQCDIPEEETTRALYALYQVPLTGSHNELQNHADKIASGGNLAEVQHFDHKHKNSNAHAISNRAKKKQFSKETLNMTSNGGQIQVSHSKKNLQQEAMKSRSINDTNNSTVQLLNKSCNFAVEKINIKQKEKHENGADVTRKLPKNKREAEQYAYGAKKKIKTEGAVDASKYRTSNGENLLKVDFSALAEGLNKVDGNSMQKHNGDYYSKDAKCNTKNRLQSSVKKSGDGVQISRDIGSLDRKSYNGREVYLKKRKIKDWEGSPNYMATLQSSGKHLPDTKVSAKEEPADGEFRKEKKSRVSRTDEESSTSKDDGRSTQKGKITRILLTGGRHNVEEIRSMERDQQPGTHRSKVASRTTLDDDDSFKRDLGSEQFSTAATSSSSKVSDSRKSRTNLRQVNGSPVASVSSSPSRTSNVAKLSPDRRKMTGTDHPDYSMVGSTIRSMNGKDNVESLKPQTAREKKVSGASHHELLGFSKNNVSHKFHGKSTFSVKPTEAKNTHLVNSDAETLEKNALCSRNLYTSDHYYDEDGMKNHDFDNALLPRKKVNGSSSHTEEKDISSGSNSGRVKITVSDLSHEKEGLSTKKKLQDEAVIGLHHLASCPEERREKKYSIKFNKDDTSFGKKGSGQSACDSRSKNQLKVREHNTLSSVGRSVSLQQNLIQNFEGQRTKKTNLIQVESRGGKSQVFPGHAGKQQTMGRVQPVSQNEIEHDVFLVDASGNGDVSKVSKQPEKPVNQIGALQSLGNPVSSQCEVRDLNASSPQRRGDASGHTASNALKEAKDLREYADRLKISGFDFECNEAYFQAALKFLHCAMLLENCNTDNYKHEEMTAMQIYNSTAKLCETCAHEYEKRQEMAAAALAYKCMEVAYMKVVYCKHSSANRDRHDLLASLQVVPQGESPSSSASDVDNLNNQAMVDKTGLSKGIGSHAGNHVIIAGNRPNFVRLLDFTHDINSAMEASMKSRNAFAAANVSLEEAQNKEGIVSVRRVIDFSFQDVEELIRLVKLAIGPISHQGCLDHIALVDPCIACLPLVNKVNFEKTFKSSKKILQLWELGPMLFSSKKEWCVCEFGMQQRNFKLETSIYRTFCSSCYWSNWKCRDLKVTGICGGEEGDFNAGIVFEE